MASINLKMGVDNAQFKTGLEQAKGKAKSFKKSVGKSLGSAFAIIGIGMGLRKVISGLDSIMEKYDRLAKLTKAHGNINVEFFQRAAFVAEQNGTSVEAVAKGMDKLLMSTKMASDGSKLYVEAFKDLNIQIVEFQKLDQEGKFKAIADAVKFSIDQDTAKAAVLQLMGMRATELMVTLQGGAAGFDSIGKSVRTLGSQGLEDIENFRDALNELKTTFVTMAAQKLPPILTEAMIFFKATAELEREGKGFFAWEGTFGVGGDRYPERIRKKTEKLRNEWVAKESVSNTKGAMLNRMGERNLPPKMRMQFSKQIEEAETGPELNEIQKMLVSKFQGQDSLTNQLQNFPSFGLSGEGSNKIMNEMLQQLMYLNEGIKIEGGAVREVTPPPKPYAFSWDD